jgi:hypothetical protein
MIWLRYLLLVLMIPAYVIALSQRRWATIPLWLVSTSVMLTQYALSVQQSAVSGILPQASPLVYVGEMTKIMVIPIAVQLAVILKGLQSRVGSRADSRPRKLVATFGAGALSD